MCKQNIFVLGELVYENKLCEQKLSADKDTETCRGREIARKRENYKMGRMSERQNKQQGREKYRETKQ